jgi:hypothetical protein
MQYSKLLDQAHALALKAKPWILKYEGHTYTAVYSMSQSVYEVFRDGEFYLNINDKNPSKAKKFLQFYLTN